MFLSPESAHVPCLDPSTRRPLVPSHTEQPQMGLKSNRNYITTNAVNNIMAGMYIHTVTVCMYVPAIHTVTV